MITILQDTKLPNYSIGTRLLMVTQTVVLGAYMIVRTFVLIKKSTVKRSGNSQQT